MEDRKEMNYLDVKYMNDNFIFRLEDKSRDILKLMEDGDFEEALRQQKLLIAKMGK